MNLAHTIALQGGGPGSGCNPEKGRCGRPRLSGPRLSGKPVLSMTSPDGKVTGHTYAIESDSGELLGRVTFRITADDPTIAMMVWIGGDSAMSRNNQSLSNVLGVRGVLSLAKDLAAKHPELRYIGGVRVGGAQGPEHRGVVYDLLRRRFRATGKHKEDVLSGMHAGGPGSGCNPDKGKCGRPKGSGKAAPLFDKNGYVGFWYTKDAGKLVDIREDGAGGGDHAGFLFITYNQNRASELGLSQEDVKALVKGYGMDKPEDDPKYGDGDWGPEASRAAERLMEKNIRVTMFESKTTPGTLSSMGFRLYNAADAERVLASVVPKLQKMGYKFVPESRLSFEIWETGDHLETTWKEVQFARSWADMKKAQRGVYGMHAGGQGSGCHGPNCGRPRKGAAPAQPKNSVQQPNEKRGRIAQMDSHTWVSRDGTRHEIHAMPDQHLTAVLRMLHQQVALARGEHYSTGPNVRYENRAVGTEGKLLERTIPPYRAMVHEARKRGVHW